jgi:hypothetical protein
MNPVDYPDAFETVRVGGLVLPGVATISGLAREMGWDVQDAKGSTGASLSRSGGKLAKFSVNLDLIRDVSQDIDDFTQWYEHALPLLQRSIEGKEPRGLSIEHPDCQVLCVNAVVVEKIDQVVYDRNDSGRGTVGVSFIEYAPPKKVSTAGPKKTQDGEDAAGGGGNPAIDSRRATLEQLVYGP